jgi:hypothetical protein
MRTLALLLAWALGALAVHAQKPPQRFHVKLSGVVTDHFSGDPIKGAMVRLLKAGKTEAEVTTRGDGKYEFELERGWRYAVWYSHEGCVTKHINIDTEEIPAYPDVPFYEMDVQIALFEFIEDFDFSVFDQPLGEAAYKKTVRNVSWDIDYTERMRPRLSATMDEYEKTYNGYYKRKAGRRPVKEKFELPKEGEGERPDPGTGIAPADRQ